eukprot:gene18454-7904_t
MSRIRRPAVLQNAKKGPFASAKAKGPFAKMAAAAAAWKQGQVFLLKVLPQSSLFPAYFYLTRGFKPPSNWKDYGVESSIDVKSAVNAISLSPDRTKAIVAGRDVLKIITQSEVDGSLEENFNLRVGKSTQTKNCTDVAWHPLENWSNEIATAAYNGHIVLWDMDSLSKEQKQKEVLTGHSRTVNSVRWHPTETFTLLSGSQDQNVKRWDVRTGGETASFKLKEGVRTALWDPMNPNQFAAATEGKSIP